MTLKEKLTKDMITAMKEKDKETLTTLRMITASIKNAEIEKRAELSDEDVQGIIQKEIKVTNESIEAYSSQNGYEEKVTQLNSRVETLLTYLPKQLNEEEISELVNSLVKELDIKGKADRGKLMGVLMPKVKGRADGKLVNAIVGKLLG